MPACPQCQSPDEPRQVGFTWWGGLIGARILHHVECTRCATRFNGRTGRSNNTAIAIYMVVAFVVVLALMYAVYHS